MVGFGEGMSYGRSFAIRLKPALEGRHAQLFNHTQMASGITLCSLVSIFHPAEVDLSFNEVASS